MPITQDLIIADVADQSAIEIALGFTLSTPLYTTADATPRTATHAMAALPVTPARTALIYNTGGLKDTYLNSDFSTYPRSSPAVAQAHIASLGLTYAQN